MKRLSLIGFVLMFFGIIVGCQSNPKGKPSFTQAEVDFYKTHATERTVEDKRCGELTNEESEFDKKCLIVAEAHRQLLTEDYTYKGKTPIKKFDKLP